MAREDCKAWERLEAEAADEAYMQELRRQHQRGLYIPTMGFLKCPRSS